MSDHISGSRALAEPISDITDVYAFPSPERSGHLVLVLNTLPFAPPSAWFSDGLVYRFRVRPVTADAGDDAALFVAGKTEFVIDCGFSIPVGGNGTRGPAQHGACTTPAGETFSFTVNDERGGSAHDVRVFAGPRWDPFIMDAPAALKTIATGKLAFTDPSSIFLDGKNVLSVVVEVDCARVFGGVELLGVVAETLTRGKLAVRLERVGRPEVKNLMLGPKQFDPVNRDLEIRDLYNMEDAFCLAPAYREAYRGMVNEICPQAALMDVTRRIAEKIASNSPTAVQAVKRAVRMGEGQPIELAIAIMMEAHWRSAVHPDRLEGIGALNDNREPTFQDPDY